MKSATRSIPKVSIVIPVFNRVSFIEKALVSLINQTFHQWEAIIVDDGSTDGSQKVIESYVEKDNRIKFIRRNREPKGASTCRNIGIEKARGRYVIFLDSDDYLLSHCLESRLNIIEGQSELDFIIFQMIVHDEIINKKVLWNIDTEDNDITRFLHFDFVWSVTSPIWKQETLVKLGGFDEELSCWQDIDLSLRAIFGKCKYQKKLGLPPDCVNVLHKETSISQRGSNKKKHLESKKRLIEKVLGLLPEDQSRSTLSCSVKHLGLEYFKMLHFMGANKFLIRKTREKTITITEYYHLLLIGTLLELRIYYRLKRVLGKMKLFKPFFRENLETFSTFRQVLPTHKY